MNLSNSSENWFFILIQVMKTIESEWFLHQNKQQNSKGTNESNYTHREIFRDPFVLSKNNFYMTPIKTYRIEVSNNKY